ncbi:hypothetical protein [Synechococcus sp. UW140]|uniref:hypothetical protein n=1 Tax=Synechococcus sp. UW140 TaxID=368503 RepID=UPI0031377800
MAHVIRIAFSLVLYKHNIDDFEPLLTSISALSRHIESAFGVELYVSDNSPVSNYSLLIGIKQKLGSAAFYYSHNSSNIGFGLANNRNYEASQLSEDDLFIVANPDTYFEPTQLAPLLLWVVHNKNIACAAPVLLNPGGSIQYSAKKNPTLLSLALGRLRFLCKLPILSKYDRWHKNMTHNYCSDCFESSYLSGSFLVIPSWAYRCVGGFSSKYFLHLEDADIVRRLSLVGSAVHNPIGKVLHLWARGSHKSFSQTFHLLRSMFTYFSIWGFCLF